MKPYFYTLLLLSSLSSFTMPIRAAEPAPKPVVYVIPIQDMIERGLVYVVRRGIAQAVDNKASAIIFDMNTPGGRLDATEDIIHMLLNLPESIKTYTLVNPDALSAGSMIALSTDYIYMTPGSRIGASAIVTSSGDIKDGDMKEKILSSTIALIKDAAKRKGHDENIVEVMMRKEAEYKIGDKEICKKGRLLTLTAPEAEELVGTDKDHMKPLLSAGTVKNLDELKEKIGLADSKTIELKETTTEKIARFIEVFSFIFLAGGLLGIYLEFKTPGFGLFGIGGITLLMIFFWGHTIAGLAGGGEMIVFMLGIMLLILEIFVIPGFGIAGVSGIVLIVASLFMSLVQHAPGLPVYHLPTPDIEGAIRTLGSSIAISFAALILLVKFLPNTSIFQHLTLSATEERGKGYTSSKKSDHLVGIKGIADNALRPSGIGIFGEKRLDVIARGDFIEENASIIVVETHGNRIIVEKSKKV